MPPDSTDTRRRLLDAAADEFARHGLAGARVDRIAELARANKRLIYAYYGNKESLFDTVVVRSIAALTDAVPFTADDLPGYAGALFDHMIAHPELVRLSMWKLLERPEVTGAELATYRPKVQAVDRAGRDGRIGRLAAPADLVMLVIGLVAAWFTASPAMHALAAEATPDATDRTLAHREAVVGAVARIVAPSLVSGSTSLGSG